MSETDEFDKLVEAQKRGEGIAMDRPSSSAELDTRRSKSGLASSLFTGGADDAQPQHSVAEITDVGAVNLHGLEVLIEVREPARHGFGPDELSLQVSKPVIPHDLGVHEPKHARYVAAIERLDAPHESVYVLLRHRSLSIPQAQGSA